MSEMTPEMVEVVKDLIESIKAPFQEHKAIALSTLLSEWKSRGERVEELEELVTLHATGASRAEANEATLERSLAEANEKIAKLEEDLGLERTNGDCIMMLREELKDEFGPEVECAFFDDVVSNACAISRRRGAAEARAIREEESK